MWDDWDRLLKQVAKTSQQFMKAIEEFRGPEPLIRVHDQDRHVKVVITPVPEHKVRHWAVRVWEDRLFIRGIYTVDISVRDDSGALRQEKRSEEFVKVVRLPGPVESKPHSFRKDGDTLIILFNRKQEDFSNGWINLQP